MSEEQIREEIYKLLDEHNKTMSIVTLVNAKNQITASTVNEIMKLVGQKKSRRAYCEVCRVFIDADTGERTK